MMTRHTLAGLCSALFLALGCTTPAHAAPNGPMLNVTVDAPGTVSVGTLNLYHYPVHLEDRINAMKTEASTLGFPSIMGFQEAALWPNDKSLFTTFTQIVEPNGYRETTNNFEIIKDGVGIASSYAAVRYEAMPLPNAGISKQDAQFAIFETIIGPLLFVNVHTSPGPLKKSARVAQLKAILAHIQDRGSAIPTVIVGDLNDDVTSEEIQFIEGQGWVDALNNQGLTYDHKTNPYTMYPVSRRLDYIFYRPAELRVVRADIRFTKNIMSDHYGLSAVFARK
jgi:endonuclease/exonuclease/phosphatase family metal-dependent hydrolase